jgi:hypothetical protein
LILLTIQRYVGKFCYCSNVYAFVLASFNEDDKLLMMAKINFFATQVGQHANIINFVGAVTDNIHRKYSVFFVLPI